MPFKFVDDGGPEADDYANNYVWVEPVTAPRRSPPPDRTARIRKLKQAAARLSRRPKPRFWPFG